MTTYNKQEYLKNIIRRSEDEAGRDSAEDMDIRRHNTRVYEYLCRLEEAKRWCEDNGCTKTASLDEFEEEMRKGVILAQLAQGFASECVKKIFISDTLQYRHTDNINYFLNALEAISFPRVFMFETFDLYDKRNFPKVIYCLHALAHYLERAGKTIKIRSLAGKISFTEEEVLKKEMEINNLGANMPTFDDIKERMNTNINIEQSKNVLRAFCHYKISKQSSCTHTKKSSSEVSEDSMSRKAMEQILKKKLKALVWERSFDDIIYQKKVSVHTLRRFLPFFFKQSEEMEKEREIEQLHTEIIKKRKVIFDLESYLEEIKMKITLLTDNKVTLSNIVVTRPLNYVLSYLPIRSENYRVFQRIFYVLQNEPVYIATILSNLDEDDIDDFVLTMVLPLFSFIQGRREEFLMSRLIDFVLKDDSGYRMSTRLVVNVFRKSKEGLELERNLLKFIKKLGSCNTEDLAERIAGHLADVLKSAPLYLRRFFAMLDGVSAASLFLDEFAATYFVSPELYDSELSSLKKESYKLLQLVKSTFTVDPCLDSKAFELEHAHNAYGPHIYTYSDNKKPVLYLTTEECNSFLETLAKNLKLTEKDPLHQVICRAVPFEHSEYLIPFYLNDPELLSSENSENLAITNFINRTKQKVLFILSVSEGRNIREMLYSISDKEVALFEKQLPFFRDYNLDSSCRGEDQDASCTESAFDGSQVPKAGSECPGRYGLMQFKNMLLEDLSYLESKQVISSFDDILSMLAQDIITLKLMSNERSTELALNKKTKANLERKVGYLTAKAKAYEEYLASFASKLVAKKKTGFFGLENDFKREGKSSLYGTYKYTAGRLKAKGVLVGIKETDSSLFGSVYFYLICNDPLVFQIEMFIKDRMVGSDSVRIDELLKMKCYGVKTVDVCRLAEFCVEGFIDLINDKYME